MLFDEDRLQRIRAKYHDWRRVDMEDLDLLYALDEATYGELRFENDDIFAKVLRCMHLPMRMPSDTDGSPAYPRT